MSAATPNSFLTSDLFLKYLLPALIILAVYFIVKELLD